MFFVDIEKILMSDRRVPALNFTYQGDASSNISEQRVDIWCKGDVIEERREGRACDFAS